MLKGGCLSTLFGQINSTDFINTNAALKGGVGGGAAIASGCALVVEVSARLPRPIAPAEIKQILAAVFQVGHRAFGTHHR